MVLVAFRKHCVSFYEGNFVLLLFKQKVVSIKTINQKKFFFQLEKNISTKLNV